MWHRKLLFLRAEHHIIICKCNYKAVFNTDTKVTLNKLQTYYYSLQKKVDGRNLHNFSEKKGKYLEINL